MYTLPIDFEVRDTKEHGWVLYFNGYAMAQLEADNYDMAVEQAFECGYIE